MKGKTIMKGKLFGTALIVLIVLAALCIVGVCIYFNTPMADAKKNRRVMIEYIEAHYGKDYRIVEEFLGKVGSGGRFNDVLTIEQDGFQYEVYASDQEIVRDTYNNAYAGKIVIDYLNSNSLAEAQQPYTVSCTVLSDEVDGKIDRKLENIEAVAPYRADLVINARNIPADELTAQKWMYDVYCEMVSVVPDTSLFIITFLPEEQRQEPGLILELQTNREQSADELLSEEDFFALFHQP